MPKQNLKGDRDLAPDPKSPDHRLASKSPWNHLLTLDSRPRTAHWARPRWRVHRRSQVGWSTHPARRRRLPFDAAIEGVELRRFQRALGQHSPGQTTEK